MAFVIKCCKDCVPPKRHRACHGTCPEYKGEVKRIEEERKLFRKNLSPDISAFEYNEIDYCFCKGHKKRKKYR